MEYIDLYDENRQSTGEVIVRGETIPLGRYKLSVHMWITNKQGEVYIQKRASCRKIFPDKWENPGGGVVAGQDSITTLQKEFEEELGISLTGKYKLIKTIKRKHDFVDIYHIEEDFDVNTLNLQDDEVSECKWATIDELNDMIEQGEFCPTILDSFIPFLEYFKKI